MDFSSSFGCEQMVTEPAHIDGGDLDLVLTDVQDLVEILVGSSVWTSNYCSIFIDVFLEYRQANCILRKYLNLSVQIYFYSSFGR